MYPCCWCPHLALTEHLWVLFWWPLEPIGSRPPPPLLPDFFRGFSDAELLVLPCTGNAVFPSLMEGLCFTLILCLENSCTLFQAQVCIIPSGSLPSPRQLPVLTHTVHTTSCYADGLTSLGRTLTAGNRTAHLLPALLETVSQSPVDVLRNSCSPLLKGLQPRKCSPPCL